MTSDPVALPPERSGYEAPTELADRRAMVAGAMASGVWATTPLPVESLIAGRRALRFDPPGTSRGRVVHFHGGAYRMGAPETVAPFAAALALESGFTVFCPAYRLAPEYPFPAGLADSAAVLLALRSEEDGLLIVTGDSAGGGLAAALTAFAIGHNVQIDGLVLLSALLDLTVRNPSYDENEQTDPLFSRKAALEAAELYLQGVSPDDPLASPLFGRVTGFPPTLVNVGAGEVLAGDSRAFHDRLLEAGVVAQLQIVNGMDHVAVTRGLQLPGAADTFAAIVAFIDTVATPDR